jgi:hypothetical protein
MADTKIIKNNPIKASSAELLGSARGPIITNGYRDAITLLSPCRDPLVVTEGLKNSAVTCRTLDNYE